MKFSLQLVDEGLPKETIKMHTVEQITDYIATAMQEMMPGDDHKFQIKRLT